VPSDFGLTEKPLMPQEQLGAAISEIEARMAEWDVNWELVEPDERIHMQERIATMLAELSLTMDTRWMATAKLMGYNDNFVEYIQKERLYKQKLDDWHSYLEWKANRNPTRAALEEKYGYDTKHGMHLVRLVEMCEELLTHDTVTVKRPNADKLLSIRHGDLSYDELMEWLKNKETALAVAYNQNKTLPKEADVKAVNDLCEKSIRDFLDF
jgi:hypothetical protein